MNLRVLSPFKQTPTVAPPVRGKLEASPPSRVGQVVEDSVTAFVVAGATALMSATSAALVPAGAGLWHWVGAGSFGLAAASCGAAGGGLVGETVKFAARHMPGGSRSSDRQASTAVASAIAGGVAVLGAALAGGLPHASPQIVGLVTGGIVLATGLGCTLLNALRSAPSAECAG